MPTPQESAGITPASQTPILASYRPFPTFEQFARADFDVATFDRATQRLRDAKQATDPAAIAEIIARATRMAAADTGAIENLYQVDRGFTFSVAADAAAWDTIHQLKGEAVTRVINDALTAYDYVLDLATGSRPITEAWIRQLHEVLCASQDTYTVITPQGPQEQALPKGVYKTQPNNPLTLASGVVHAYAPVADTSGEMARLVAELSSDRFADSHPVLQAAYAHYAFVCVHPFADGNGRVSRALASAFLYREPGVPLVIFADQKPAYLDALEAADSGQIDAFIRFVGDRAFDTVRMVTDDLGLAAVAKDAPELNSRVTGSLTGRGGFAHTDIDLMAARLTDEVVQAFQGSASDKALPPEISLEVQKYGGDHPSQTGEWRAAHGAGYVELIARTPNPPAVSRGHQYQVLVAKPAYTDADFLLVSGNQLVGDFFIRDVHPVVSTATHHRLRTITKAIIWRLVQETAAEGEKRLREAGYL